uniref:Reverse transcriptase domain-containing protein n=1 Tax=Steinernema glaseri TaxID=37863 RepID=A0A1I7Z9B6_9BILA
MWPGRGVGAPPNKGSRFGGFTIRNNGQMNIEHRWTYQELQKALDDVGTELGRSVKWIQKLCSGFAWKCGFPKWWKDSMNSLCISHIIRQNAKGMLYSIGLNHINEGISGGRICFSGTRHFQPLYPTAPSNTKVLLHSLSRLPPSLHQPWTCFFQRFHLKQLL